MIPLHALVAALVILSLSALGASHEEPYPQMCTYACPYQDNLGFPGEQLLHGVEGELFCGFKDEVEDDEVMFYCIYSTETGALVADWNMGSCPTKASCGLGSGKGRNSVPRSALNRGMYIVDVRPSVMKTRSTLGISKRRLRSDF
ncbi:hypothetical protein CC2G_007946 [Coprinopsis cinerea AmutBmut pab1-1]|nr:hypothetical protein CC2G_007946 [Coprinopsis cinerea AmutBmut pab1-1]